MGGTGVAVPHLQQHRAQGSPTPSCEPRCPQEGSGDWGPGPPLPAGDGGGGRGLSSVPVVPPGVPGRAAGGVREVFMGWIRAARVPARSPAVFLRRGLMGS